MKHDKIEHRLCGQGLRDTLNEPILRIGAEQLSRSDLVNVYGVGNFTAAIRLNHVLGSLGYPTASQLAKIDPQSIARRTGVGETQLYLLSCVLEVKGVDVFAWWRWDREGREVRFSTHKHHAVRRAKKRPHKE